MTTNPEEQLVIQKIFENVWAGRDITIGDIQQIYQIGLNLSNTTKPTGFPQNIPLSSTDKFVGREKELESLHKKLQQNNQVVIAAVEGMGGVGKTELAIQYSLLHLQLHTYPGGIFWLQAREEDIGLQIVNFAKTDLGLQPPDDLELPEQIRWCWQHWRQGNTLVVVDDVKNYTQVEPFLPPQLSRFQVLLTTRLKLDVAGSLVLEILEPKAALQLLAQLVGPENVTREQACAAELCQRLGYLPLALQLVGRYVKTRKISLAKILRRLEEKGLGHPSLEVKTNNLTWTLNIRRGVTAAFELSWSELSDEAQKLGRLLSLFALAPLNWSLVEKAASEQDQEELEDGRVELENLHLLHGEDTYQLHQLVREFLQKKLAEQAETEDESKGAEAQNMKRCFCQVMVAEASQISYTPTQQEIAAIAPAIAHIAEAVTVLKDWLSDEDLIEPFVGLGWFYQDQGFYQQALPWLEQCLSFARERLGEEHPFVATSYNILGFTLPLSRTLHRS